MTIDQMIDDIIRREGGYVNHPADRGGPTKYGITLVTLRAWVRGRKVDASDVMELTEEEARHIYRANYFVKPGIDQLPPALQPFLFDCAVNHGPTRAVKFLQNVLRELGHTVTIDGKIGPKTCGAAIAAVAKHGERRVLERLIERRRTFYLAIVDRDPSQKVFLKGWLNRLTEFERTEEEPFTREEYETALQEYIVELRQYRAELDGKLAAAEARIAELEAVLAKLARHLPDDARAIIVDMATEETVGHLVGRQWNE